METYEFTPRNWQKKEIEVSVAFVHLPIAIREIANAHDTREVYYCTILVNDDRKYTYHHGGTVVSPSDKYNHQTGIFKAFQNALRRRWLDQACIWYPWEEYKNHWCRFLREKIDGKVINDPIPF